MSSVLVFAVLGSAACLMAQPADDLSREVRDTATAFMRAVNRRDMAAFRGYLAPEAMFVSADAKVWNGREFVAGDEPRASMAGQVDVLPSGTLALVSGSLRDPEGESVWRRDGGRWTLVLDYECRAYSFETKPAPPEGAAGEVWRNEVAFAKTMADRDHAAFATYVAEDAVFLTGGGVLRGREQVAQGWKRLYEGPNAPFSWQPHTVLVLDSGGLAFSRGPVRNPDGKIRGTFASVWRKDPDGRWRVVLDRGCSASQKPN